MAEELWLPVFGILGCDYEVSNFGRIRSFRRGAIRILSPRDDGFGYQQIQMRLPGDNKKKNYRVHRVVAQTFSSPTDNRPHVNHKNWNKADNRLSNLEFCTNLENQQHSRHSASHSQIGVTHSRARFNADQVRLIRSMRNNGLTYTVIGEYFDSPPSTVRGVANGSRYTHI